MLNYEESQLEHKEDVMPPKKVKVKTFKRRAQGHVRKTVTVRGHYRSLPKSQRKHKR